MSDSQVSRKIKVSKKRLERFDFTSISKVRRIKEKIEGKPELSDRLKGDFVGTLRDEGLEIDEEFLRETKNKWRSQVQEDIRRKMLRRPPSEKRYFQRVAEGKPLKLRVRIDPSTGERTIRLRDEGE